MGFWRSLVGIDLSAPDVDPDSLTFAVDDQAIPPSVVGLESYSTVVAAAPKVSRREAIQVPAVKRARDLVCATLGGLPLDLYDSNRQPVTPSPFDQPERNVPRSVTMTRTFEDMFFEQVAWWQITESDYRGYPAYFKRLKPGQVSVDEEAGRVLVDGKEFDQSKLVRFDSPTDGLLTAGARAIRTCLQLDAAAANGADGVPPIQYFTSTDDVDPDDDEVTEFLDNWNAARRARRVGWVPSFAKLVDAGWDAEKVQLIEQRQHAVLEIARLTGVDPEELGVSTTSRTYSNQFDRRKAFTDFTLGLYRQAFEDRISMGDVTPRGTYAKFNLNAFLRSDPLTRYQSYAAGLEVGALDESDVARLEDRPAVAPVQNRTPVATVTPLPTRTEETA